MFKTPKTKKLNKTGPRFAWLWEAKYIYIYIYIFIRNKGNFSFTNKKSRREQ